MHAISQWAKAKFKVHGPHTNRDARWGPAIYRAVCKPTKDCFGPTDCAWYEHYWRNHNHPNLMSVLLFGGIICPRCVYMYTFSLRYSILALWVHHDRLFTFDFSCGPTQYKSIAQAAAVHLLWFPVGSLATLTNLSQVGPTRGIHNHVHREVALLGRSEPSNCLLFVQVGPA